MWTGRWTRDGEGDRRVRPSSNACDGLAPREERGRRERVGGSGGGPADRCVAGSSVLG